MAEQELPVALEGRSIPPQSFLRPLEFIFEEHARQRALCDWLEELANEPGEAVVIEHASSLLKFLTGDLNRHTQDEEIDLFPLLRERCRPEDGVEAVLDQLSAEHALDKDLIEFIVHDLEAAASGFGLAYPLRFFINLKAFAETQRRHLAWENTVVLPMAKLRISREDEMRLGRAMATRRDIAYQS